MAAEELQGILQQLQGPPALSAEKANGLLTAAKRQLLKLDILLPSRSSPAADLEIARKTLETGALVSIRLKLPDAFVRYFRQLTAFYELPASLYLSKDNGQRSKITGLYLLLLLTKGDYAEFHTVLEGLEMATASDPAAAKTSSALSSSSSSTSPLHHIDRLEADAFIGYPVKLERWLMEGSYNQIWKAIGKEAVPSEEYGLFSEIASCSEKAYPSIPIQNAKSLLFLESEGSVLEFARTRGWKVKDDRICFVSQEDPDITDTTNGRQALVLSDQMIENTIGYARELEMIV